MRLYRKLEKFLIKCINLLWKLFVTIHEKKNIRQKKHLIDGQTLTTEQKQEIDAFYKKHYGRKVSHKWHKLYKSYTGQFDYKYIPEYLFSTKMELLSNKRHQVLPLENKALLSNFVRGQEELVRIPETYVVCVDGRYYDGNKNIISKEACIELLKTLQGGDYQAVCKKTTDTSSGRDVCVLDIKAGVDVSSQEKIEDIISKMGNNFIVQERISPHPTFAALYPGSVNTLRVISYQTSGQYKVAPIVMRIGRNGNVDNAHAGGMFVGVKSDGTLMKEAFTEYQERYTQHPVTGTVFENYVIPRVPDIIKVAIEMHKNYPTLQFISWDLTVDQNENIVLIEANLHTQAVWISQMAHGTAFFGEDTAEMLHLISKQK